MIPSAYADMVRDDILQMIPDDGQVIGSIGCGGGATERQLVLQGRQVHGVDINPQAVAVATTRLTSARVFDASQECPFAPKSLDGLILADVIEHLPMAWKALASFAQAVRPGGWVVISVPNMRSIYVLREFFIQGDWPEHPSGIFDQTHVQVMTRRRLQRWYEMAGLRIEKWFDRYDPHGPRRRRLLQTIDLMSLGTFHSWFMYQLQVRCRR